MGEGLHWGLGYASIKDSIDELEEKEAERRRETLSERGFAVKSAEPAGNSILVRAVNTYHRPARIDAVTIREIYPEPKQKRLFIGIGHLEFPEKTGEELFCQWRVSGVNLTNHGEVIAVEVTPSKPFEEGCLYEIAVGRKWCREELETTDGMTFKTHNMGSPAAFICKNGRLEKPQTDTKPSHAESSGSENRFCINCGVKISSSANYCPSCGTKQ